MDYIKGLPLAPHRCRSAPHQLPLATAVCTIVSTAKKAVYFLNPTKTQAIEQLSKQKEKGFRETARYGKLSKSLYFWAFSALNYFAFDRRTTVST